MKQPNQNELRVLAVDPTTRGFGFTLLEGPNRLIDWGTRTARENKEQECLRKLGQLIAEYQPDVVVVENCAAKGSRRCGRVRQLIEAMAEFAAARKIRFQRISRQQGKAAFDGASSKHAIATFVAERFPELAPILPHPRRPWENEAHSMAVFDAAALGVALLKRTSDGVVEEMMTA